MTIEFDCPSCKTKMRAADFLAGRKLRCGNCCASFVVPAASGPPAAMHAQKPVEEMDRLLAADGSDSIFGD
ncbi:hypothetical protein AYO44_15585 [Planctomycetaceae bacterium SCGC AG-212-F19]|nr:hypothetical protein AYO44_15585 [Planctomycetaceae bacterium SCGC AG-212-F19]